MNIRLRNEDAHTGTSYRDFWNVHRRSKRGKTKAPSLRLNAHPVGFKPFHLSFLPGGHRLTAAKFPIRPRALQIGNTSLGSSEFRLEALRRAIQAARLCLSPRRSHLDPRQQIVSLL